MIPPLPPDLGLDHLTVVENALIMPPVGKSGVMHAGVFSATGRFVNESVVWRGHDPVTIAPPSPAPAQQRLPGTHLYGGYLSQHFGHFMCESLARMWALDLVGDTLQNALFVPRRKWETAPPLQPFQAEFFKLFGLEDKIQLVMVPTLVERLIVPSQGFGIFQLETASPAFRRCVKSRSWPKPKPDAAKSLYVGRTGLRAKKGGLVGEHKIAEMLAQQGYANFQPEKHTLEEQLAAYQAAERLIFLEGSTLHSFGFVARDDQKVAVIQRRGAIKPPYVAQRQLKSFAGIDVVYCDAVTHEWLPEGSEVTSKSIGEADLPLVFDQLASAGFLSSVLVAPLTDTEIRAEIAQSEVAHGCTFVRREVPSQLGDQGPQEEQGIVATFRGVKVLGGPHLNHRKIRSLRNGFYERQEVNSALATIQRSDRVLELGAGAGVVGATIALNCRPAAILSFEPNPALIDPARALHKYNGLDKIITLRNQIVLAEDNPKPVQFGVVEGYLSSQILDDSVPHAGAAPLEIVDVETVGLETVVAEFQPNVLVMDIEGAEREFLRNADLSAFRLVIVELHRNLFGREGMKECRNHLSAAGLVKVGDLSRRWVDVFERR